MNESEVREIIEVSLMEYANTLDYKKALDHGIERFINLTKQGTTTNLSNNVIARETQKYTPPFEGTIERFTNEHYLDNEQEIKEL